MSRAILFDIEADGLLDTVSTVHCLVMKELTTGKKLRFYNPIDEIEPVNGMDYSLDYIRPVFKKATTLIGHNIIGYDDDILKRFFNLDEVVDNVNIIDTLVWSQTLNPDRKLPKDCPTSYFDPVLKRLVKVTPHSVEAWGYRLARKKPHHFDWSKFSKEMLFRCEEDVEIQEKIFYALLKEAGLKFEDMVV